MNKFKTKEYRELKSKNYRLFSFSELSVIQECNLQYYYQYIQRIKGRNNVYSFLGDIVHNSIEDFYSKNIDKEEMLDSFRINFNNCQYSFDNENIKNIYYNSVYDYLERLHHIDTIKIEQEKLVYFPLKNISNEFNNFAFHGFIDLILFHKDGTVSIVDYKTSTKYSGEDRVNKSFQLVLYAMALEHLGYKIKNIAWDFIKTCRIQYIIKNKKYNKIIKRTEIPQYFGFEDIKISHDILKIELTKELRKKTIDWVINYLIEIKKNKEIEYDSIKVKKEIDYFCKSLCSYYYVCKKNT